MDDRNSNFLLTKQAMYLTKQLGNLTMNINLKSVFVIQDVLEIYNGTSEIPVARANVEEDFPHNLDHIETRSTKKDAYKQAPTQFEEKET